MNTTHFFQKFRAVSPFDYERAKGYRSAQKVTGAKLVNSAIAIRNGQRVRIELYSLPVDDGDHDALFLLIDDNDRKEKLPFMQSSTYDASSAKSARNSFRRACQSFGAKPARKI